MIRNKAVLFDVDGTLLDAWDFVFMAFKYSLTMHGYSLPSDEAVKKAMGKSLIEFYKTLFPKADHATLAKTHRQFQEDKFNINKLFPKTKTTLEKLREMNFLIAAVSNRMRDSLWKSLNILEIDKYFDKVVSADDVVNPKPHPEHLFFALDLLEVMPKDAYMVGDTSHDIEAGRKAGVKTVGVTYGFLGKEIAKSNPDFLIDDLEEIIEIVNR